MLKQKLPYIAVFKTNAGEEFLAEVIDEDADSYRVKHPLCIVMGDNGVRFAPYLMMADPEHLMNIPKPIITADPVESIIVQYKSITTGIALPQKSSIIV